MQHLIQGSAALRQLESAHSIITWSDDGTRVMKAFPAHRPPPQIYDRSRFDYERRVNALLLRHPPQVSFAPMLGADRRSRTLTFAAVDGEPIGEKFPTELDDATVDELVGLAWAVPSRVSSCRWLRKLSIVERLNSAVAIGAVSPGEAERIRSIALAHRPVLRLCHGDLTARNVLRSGRAGLVLIDWEWAGLYPLAYDAAFLWYSLVDVVGARDRVAASAAASARPWFWISALLIQLLHLGIYRGRSELSGYLPRQLATRDELVDRVLTLAAP